jgi:hypothetical protein
LIRLDCTSLDARAITFVLKSTLTNAAGGAGETVTVAVAEVPAP